MYLNSVHILYLNEVKDRFIPTYISEKNRYIWRIFVFSYDSLE